MSKFTENKFHLLSIEECETILQSDMKAGLRDKEAERRHRENGANVIENGKRQGIIYKFLSQFKDLMIIILLISALISFIMSKVEGSESADAFIILFIVVINAIIGTAQEYKADKAIDALKKLSSPKATVLRNGRKQCIESAKVVLGDIVILKSGDVCPADVRLIDSVELYAEESSLTGEADAVHKSEEYEVKEVSAVSERKNTVFAGSNIVSGHGKGMVTAIGSNTEMGKIANMLKTEASPETPLTKKLNYISKVLAFIVVLISLVIYLLGIIRGNNPVNMLMISISLAVAAIPEGLAAVVTIVLALGVKRMAKKNAIIRKPLAVETLGSTTVICSDKTGTLTENKMTVTKLASVGGFVGAGNELRRNIITLASLCNNSEVSVKGEVKGTPTEKAITECYINECSSNLAYKRIGEIPFSSKRKMMTTVHEKEKGFLVVSKGNPEVILNKCTHYEKNNAVLPLDSFALSRINSLNTEMESEALRVLAVAKKEEKALSENDNEIESNLVFVGLIGIEDKPRKEVKSAVVCCKNAGIKPVMITGDQPGTALSIAKKTGIIREKEQGKVLTGETLKNISIDELSKIINNYSVFAKVSPEDKMKIVKAYEKNGEIVAMTGDGVNDAPALKTADIGCAMGKNGTEAAKGAADIVLTDDNFATIVEAVKEGRNIFVNIRKTIHFLISSNIGEVLLIFASFLFSLPVPLLPTQLLWVNLVTDSFPALALGAGRCESDNMDKEFLKNNKDVLTASMWLRIVLEGMFIGALSLLAFTVGRCFFDSNIYDPIVGRTMAFSVLCFSQIVHSFNAASDKSIFSKKRSKNKLLFKSAFLCSMLMIAVVTIPALQKLFNTTALNLTEWLIVIILSLMPLIIGEAEKLISKHKKCSED